MRIRNLGIFALALVWASAVGFTAQAQTTAAAQPFVVGGHIEIVDGQVAAVGGQMVVDVDEALPSKIQLKHGAVLNFVRKQGFVGTDVTVQGLPPKVVAFCICRVTQPVASANPAGYFVVQAIKGDTPGVTTFEITHTVPGSTAKPSVQTVDVEVLK